MAPSRSTSHLTVPCRLCQAAILPSTSAKTGSLCLDCFHSEGQRLARDARESAPGCPACDGSTKSEVFSFDWERARRGEGDYRKYPRYLRHERDVKHGARYACTVCGATWYLDQKARRGQMIRVPARYLPAFDTWCAQSLVCPAPILDAAHAIGATPPGVYGLAHEAWIPCRVTTHRDERIDFAMLRFSDEPPVSRLDDKPERMAVFRTIDEVAAIAPSRFALPRRVRFRTSWVLEQRMNFSPVPVVTSRGRRFILNGCTDFFDHDRVAGSDLRLAWNSSGAKLAPDPPTPLTIFAADWFAGAESLYIPAPALADWLWQWLHWRWVRMGL